MSGLSVHPAAQLALLLGWAVQAYLAVLVLHGFLAWVRADPGHGLVRVVARPAAPLIERVRRALPVALRHFPVDVAFLVVLCLALCLRYGLVATLAEAVSRLP